MVNKFQTNDILQILHYWCDLDMDKEAELLFLCYGNIY